MDIPLELPVLIRFSASNRIWGCSPISYLGCAHETESVPLTEYYMNLPLGSSTCARQQRTINTLPLAIRVALVKRLRPRWAKGLRKELCTGPCNPTPRWPQLSAGLAAKRKINRASEEPLEHCLKSMSSERMRLASQCVLIEANAR
jgi:hypothetical protein